MKSSFLRETLSFLQSLSLRKQGAGIQEIMMSSDIRNVILSSVSLIKLSTFGESFHDLISSLKNIWHSSILFQLLFGYDEMSTEPGKIVFFCQALHSENREERFVMH